MSQNGHKVIGSRPIRHDGVDKVTGRAIYGADIQLTGLLYGAIKRSPHPHARIKDIDTSRAEAHPGVRAVVTAHDLPQIADKLADLGEAIVNLRDASNNVLAYGKVLYKGHAVAGVAAVNLHVAQEAVELIDVEYEPLDHVTGVLEAMEDGAPILHEDMKTTSMGEETDKVSNVANHFQHKMGEPDDGFAEADVVIEREFTTQTVHQGYIESHNATALWNEEGQLTVWTSTQGAFSVRDQMAEILQIPISKVKIVPLEIGGGFGGKISVYLDPVASLLSKKTGHPVKMTMTRDEVFEGTGPTPGSYLRVKMGATSDGRLTAATAYMAYEAGAYPGSPVGAGAGCIFTPYDIPNVQIDGFDVCVNKPKTNAYRAPGATNAAFATETVVDELSEQIGMDPLAFRVKNGAKEGTRRADGPVHPVIGCIETTEAALNSEHYRSNPGKVRERQGPRPGRRVRLLVQLQRRPVGHLRQHQSRRHHQHAGGLDGHRRLAGVHRHAAGRDHRPRGHRHQALRGGHGLHRLYRRDRRQPDDLRNGLRRPRHGPGPHPRDQGAGVKTLGRARRRH